MHPLFPTLPVNEPSPFAPNTVTVRRLFNRGFPHDHPHNVQRARELADPLPRGIRTLSRTGAPPSPNRELSTRSLTRVYPAPGAAALPAPPGPLVGGRRFRRRRQDSRAHRAATPDPGSGERPAFGLAGDIGERARAAHPP